MAEPSAINMNGQIQQNAWPQTASQQQPLHPMVAGGGPMPTLPIQGNSMQGYGKTKEITVNMSRLSLLGISFCLMLLGALTFLGGFLLGMWFAGPSTPYVPTGLGEVVYPYQTQPSPQNIAIPAQGENTLQNLTGRAGEFTQSAVSSTKIPTVPSFLAPLVTATQTAAGQQLGHNVQQQVNRQRNQGRPSSPQLQPPLSPENQRTMPSPHYSTYPTQPHEQTLPTVATSQKGIHAPPSGGPSPLSQGGNDGYTIQLGVYASKDNAYALVNDLQALNFISHITESKAPDGTRLYYVHSGHYKDYTTALEAASQFASQNIPGAIIVKISQKNMNAS
jgi:cell division septation protein DedD